MNTEKQIEFDQIRERWSNLAMTEGAKGQIREISFYLSENELRKHLRDTTDSKEMIERLGTPPLQNVDEVKEILMIAEKGECLTPYQLERVEKILVAVRRLKVYLERGKYADQTSGMVNARMTFDKETLSPTYQMVIGEAGESCAFYIADRLGMPGEMLRNAVRAAYGEEAVDAYCFRGGQTTPDKTGSGKITKIKQKKKSADPEQKFKRWDSVMLRQDHKIGIVCEPVNEKGVLRVQLLDKKIWINHKRVKLHVAAAELYPEDYDFSIIFDTVANRKIRHEMDRKYTTEMIQYEE